MNSRWSFAAPAAVLFILFNAQLAFPQTKVSILHAVIGPKQVPLWIAQEQGLFAKHGLEVQLGIFDRRVPGHRQLSRDNPFGALGIPVAIAGGAEGSAFKLLVAFSSAGAATAHLVARSGVNTRTTFGARDLAPTKSVRASGSPRCWRWNSPPLRRPRSPIRKLSLV